MTLHDVQDELHKIGTSQCISAECREVAKILRDFLTHFVPFAKLDWEGDAFQLYEKVEEMWKDAKEKV